MSLGPQLDLELFCFIHGDDPRHVFPVKIARTESVGTLKKAIKDEKKLALKHVDADSLTLWNVSIAVDKDFKENVGKFELRDDDALSPVDRLSKIFDVQPDSGHLHIIVRSLNTDAGEFEQLVVATSCLIHSLVSISFCLLHLRYHVASHALPSDAVPDLPIMTWQKCREQCKKKRAGQPSQQAQPAEFKELQKDDICFYGCNRPPGREAGLPLTLLHPVFGKFVDDASAITPTRDDYAIAYQLRNDMCDFYSNEAERRHKICSALQDYGIPINPGTIGGSEHKTDGHVFKNWPMLILELKNEIGSKGAEPSLQALLYYRTFCDEYDLWDNYSTCHPCFITYLAGESHRYRLG